LSVEKANPETPKQPIRRKKKLKRANNGPEQSVLHQSQNMANPSYYDPGWLYKFN